MIQRLNDRHKLGLVLVVLCISAVWIIFFIIRASNPHGTLHNPDTPATNQARELQDSIYKLGGCDDVGVSVVTDNPLVLRLDGVVRSNEIFARLEKAIFEFGPQAQVENKVVVMP